MNRNRLTWATGGLLALLSVPCAAQSAPENAPPPQAVPAPLESARLAQANSAPADGSAGTEKKDDASTRTPRFTYGGQADFYWSHNFNDPFNSKNQLRAWDIQDDRGFHLGLIDLWAQHTRDPIGFRIDTVFGPTARLLNAFEPSHSNVWEHLEQVYVSANLDGRKGKTYVDFGKWTTPAGAEVIAPVDNWLYSRGLLFNFAMPFYHLGGRVYHYFDSMDYVMLHVNRGWNAVGDPGHGPGFGITGSKMFGKKWMVMGNYLGGDEFGMKGTSYRSLFDFVATDTASAKWTFTHNLDFGWQTGSTWYGLSSQAKYAFRPRQYLAARAEIFRDQGGMMTGSDQTLTSLTLGYTYQFNKNAQTRVEYRHDFSGGARPFFGDTLTSFHNGQGTLLVAGIVSF